MTTPEARVRDPVTRFAKRIGVYHVRMHFGRGAKTGRPDDLFIFKPDGHHYWIEFKASGKEPEPIQHDRIRELREQGADVDWFNNVDAACEAIARRVAARALSAESRGSPARSPDRRPRA